MEKEEDEEHWNGPFVLEGLALSLQCLCLLLNVFNVMKVKTIIDDSWHDVDDINFICVQIQSRTEEQWGKDHKDDHSAKINAMKVITLAKELQGILASVETARQ